MRTSRKLAASFATLISSFFLLRVNGWFGLGFLIGLPLTILYWFDYGQELRAMASPSRARRVLGMLMGIPQALFGGVCLVTGIAIVVWVLYNSLWRRMPEFSGSFLSFGIGPLLALFGFGLIADAFKKAPPSNETQPPDAPA